MTGYSYISTQVNGMLKTALNRKTGSDIQIVQYNFTYSD